ncbi:MAG: preprotein translocase subunit SecE [Clostridiaceae bacterium]|jgi:preprotein translocase subunit SecE|nr:preprotein translocase subunit SecE [Oscillospiraceae bacterium]NLO62137.1 preprotein translocase subunit SecE [Clostridiaceae bacterium]
MSTKKTSNTTGNIFIRIGRAVIRFFKRIGGGITNVRQELKRVLWPTREKLIQTSVIVLVVIAVAAIILTAIGSGARHGLEAIGFYEVKDRTVETTVLPDTGETTVMETGTETIIEVTTAE